MPSSLALLLATALSAASASPEGLELAYRGQLLPNREGEDRPAKQFDITYLVTDQDQQHTVHWTLHETGAGGQPWDACAGRFTVTHDGQLTDGTRPTLRYQRQAGDQSVDLPVLIVHLPEPASRSRIWRQDELQHRLIGEERQLDRVTWRVEAANRLGPKRTLWLNPDAPLVVALRERVFLGQGEEFELSLELASQRQIDSSATRRALAGFAALATLQAQFGSPPDEPRRLTRQQTAEATRRLEGIRGEAQYAPLDKVTLAAGTQLERHGQRDSAVASLGKKAVGSRPLGYRLRAIDQAQEWTAASTQGRVLVLHFWEYQDEPLKPPYGQAGYVDFLARQLEKQEPKQVEVLGIVSHPRLADQQARGAAIRSARRFREFMNLSYPLVTDEGQLLAQLGDPRRAEAELPLFVVLDRGGKVIHYHAGHYAVDANRGLEQLSEVVKQALQTDR